MGTTRVFHSLEYYQEKAGILIDALPYLRDFRDKTVVICYNCNDKITPEIEESMLRDVTTLHSVGIHIVLVHGKRTGSDIFRENKRLAKMIELNGVKGIGICGIDEETLHMTLEHGYIPVVTPYDIDTEYMPLDPVDTATEIACLLHAEKLVYLSEYEGVVDPDGKLETSMTVGELMAELRVRHFSGELKKILNSALIALEDGVARVHILNGGNPHSLLVELFSINGNGTMFMQEHSALYSHEKMYYMDLFMKAKED